METGTFEVRYGMARCGAGRDGRGGVRIETRTEIGTFEVRYETVRGEGRGGGVPDENPKGDWHVRSTVRCGYKRGGTYLIETRTRFYYPNMATAKVLAPRTRLGGSDVSTGHLSIPAVATAVCGDPFTKGTISPTSVAEDCSPSFHTGVDEETSTFGGRGPGSNPNHPPHLLQEKVKTVSLHSL